MSTARVQYDTPWKDILDIYFEQFIAYCWPQYYPEIDWDRGYKSLDKELSKIVRNAAIGNRVADKLIEVYLKNGQEAYILLHIEVQGNHDVYFEERMFVSRYRLRDKYKKPIVSIAILIDTNENWRPVSYKEEMWDSWIAMGFPIIKIIDYRKNIKELEASTNPFATVILAQLATLEKDLPNAKLISKLKLIRWLYGRGWKREDVLTLLTFIDWVFALPPEFEVKCRQEVELIEEEMHVNYVTSWERMAFQRGESTFLLSLLEHKFKIIPEIYREKIEKANDETLLKWGNRVLDSNDLEEVFEA